MFDSFATQISRAYHDEERRIRSWNDVMPFRAAVYYTNDAGEIIATFTRSHAQMLGGHTAVIWLDDINGCVALSRVHPRAA